MEEIAMFHDTRLGNTPRWFFTRPRDWNMRVPDDVLKSVVFLGRVLEKGSTREFRFLGTGFFVSVPSSLPDLAYVYLVTAQHVADKLALGGDSGDDRLFH